MDIAVIIIVATLSVIALATSSFAWLPSRKDEDGEQDISCLPPLSVIIMVHDDIDLVEKNISTLLGQDYAPGYEVILVTNEGDTIAEDIMTRHKGESRLRNTFIPATSRYVSCDKLGVTLGVKAAANDWCLLIDGNCRPLSDKWLLEMGKRCNENANIVIGTSNFDDDARRYQRFFRLRHFCQLWRESRYMTVFSACHSNLCFRKSEFIGQDGYRGNLDIIRGEYDFIVNKYAKRGMTAFVTSTDAMLEELAPTRKQWNNRRRYYLYSCRTMDRRLAHRLLPCVDTVFLHLSWLTSLATIIIGVLTQNWLFIGTGVAALLIEIIGRTMIASRMARVFDARIPAWTIFPIELSSVFHTIADKIRVLLSSKYDFTCHKL